jgi:Domain of unknown function (DUF4331)
MSERRKHQLFRALAMLMAAVTVATGAPMTWAASHREAPLIALDPTADITDFYFFRSWESGKADRVVLIMNVIPQQAPASGPNFYNFDDEVLYVIHIDVDGDGDAKNLSYEFRFTTEIRPPFNDLPVSFFGGAAGIPPITALDGTGSEGLGLRQRYTVTEVRGKQRTDLGTGPLFAVPSNVGPRTMPDYEALAAQGIYPLTNGGRVFAGQREETFYIDLGSTFDSLNFRRDAPVLTDAEDADDTVNPFGVDDGFEGLNVNTIAIEVPISAVTADPGAVIGAYASTSRARATGRKEDGTLISQGPFVQVARLANPLVNELLIGTGQKDFWNTQDPKDEAQFLDFYLNPRLVAVVNATFGTPFPTLGRTDLVAALLKYPGQDPRTCTAANPCSELLRLNLGVAPTPPDQQKRLTVLAHDADGNPTPDLAGFPNGRRPNDDVTDIVLRVAAGALLGPVPNLGDGVNFNRVPQSILASTTFPVTANGIAQQFPFLPTAIPGRTGNTPNTDNGPNVPLFR